MSLYEELREISQKSGNHKAFMSRVIPRLLSGELRYVSGNVADNKDYVILLYITFHAKFKS